MKHLAPDLLEHVLDVMPDHVYLIRVEDDGGFRLEYANAALSHFLRHTRAQLQGKRFEHLVTDPEAYRRVTRRYRQVVRSGGTVQYEATSEGFKAAPFEVFDTRLAPLFDSEGRCTHICGISRNITRRWRAENALKHTNEELAWRLKEIEVLQERLRQQAVRDPLTGLFNRRYLEESLRRELHRAEREGYAVTLMLLDVDHFKPFNDTYGHQAGDSALISLAQHLSVNTRVEDVVCRFGGEEFLVLMPRSTTGQALERMATWHQPQYCVSVIPARGCSLEVSYSAGLAQYPLHGLTTEALIRTADQALYEAKRQGRKRAIAAAPPC